MTIVQKFHYEWPSGSQRIEFPKWIETLTEQEQTEYWEGRRNGDALRQVAIDEGNLHLHTNGFYEWKDRRAFEKGKENDTVWEKYWRRWQEETGVIFSTTYEEK